VTRFARQLRIVRDAAQACAAQPARRASTIALDAAVLARCERRTIAEEEDS